jgi:hypothetical protein
MMSTVMKAANSREIRALTVAEKAPALLSIIGLIGLLVLIGDIVARCGPPT